MLRSSYGAGFLSRSQGSSLSGFEGGDIMDFDQSNECDTFPPPLIVVPANPDYNLLFPRSNTVSTPNWDTLRDLGGFALLSKTYIPDTVDDILLLRIPHIFGQCIRAVEQVFALYAMVYSSSSSDDSSGDINIKFALVNVAINDALDVIARCIHTDRDTAAIVFHAVRCIIIGTRIWKSRNAFLFLAYQQFLLLLCRISGTEEDFFATRSVGVVVSSHAIGQAALQDMADIETLDKDLDALEHADLMRLETTSAFDSQIREQMHMRRPRLVRQALYGLGRDKRMFSVFFASPSRAPLSVPPFDARDELDTPSLMGTDINYAEARRLLADKQGENNETDYVGSGQNAVRRLAQAVNDLPLDTLPPCALSALMETDKTPNGTWHNKDRYVAINYFMDLGYDIEDMGAFVAQRLPDARRQNHARSHIQRYQGQINNKIQRGYMPVVTARCSALSDPDRIDAKQSFSCPFTAPFTKDDEDHLRAILAFGNVNAQATEDIVRRAMRGDREGGCLAHYNATKRTGTYDRFKPLTNPVFYTYNKALAIRHIPIETPQ